MTALNSLLATTDYFRTGAMAARIDKDTDLDPIRERLDYIEFNKKVKEEAAKYQKPPK